MGETSQTVLPEDGVPESMREALVDGRACFDGIRRSLLECKGGDLLGIQRSLERVVNNSCPQVRSVQIVRELLVAVATVTVNAHWHGDVRPPANFLARVWPHYLEVLEHGGDGRQYWLSYDELLALATIARVNLVVVERRPDGSFRYVAENLTHVGDATGRVVISSIRGGGVRAVESHFERLISAADVAGIEAAR